MARRSCQKESEEMNWEEVVIIITALGVFSSGILLLGCAIYDLYPKKKDVKG